MSNIKIISLLISAFTFFIYSFFILKKVPELSTIFVIMISIFAIYSCIEFSIDLFKGTKFLGDFENQKHILFFGAFAIVWVSIETIIEKL